MENFTRSPVTIDRGYDHVESLAITNNVSTTQAINFCGCAGGIVIVPAGSSLTSLACYVSTAINGTYVPLHGADAVAAALTVEAGKAYQLPAACYGATFLKLVGNTAGVVSLTRVG